MAGEVKASVATHPLHTEVTDGPIGEDGFCDNRDSHVPIGAGGVVQGPIPRTFHLVRRRIMGRECETFGGKAAFGREGYI